MHLVCKAKRLIPWIDCDTIPQISQQCGFPAREQALQATSQTFLSIDQLQTTDEVGAFVLFRIGLQTSLDDVQGNHKWMGQSTAKSAW